VCRWQANPWTDLAHSDLTSNVPRRPDDIALTYLGDDSQPPQDLLFRHGGLVRGIEGPEFTAPSNPFDYDYTIILPELAGEEADFGYEMIASSLAGRQLTTVWSYPIVNTVNAQSRYRVFEFTDGPASLGETGATYDVHIGASAMQLDPPIEPLPPVAHGPVGREPA
jgi:hypothetical protein